MHTTHESNYAVIKLPLNGNSKAKIIDKNNSVHWKLPRTTNGMDALDNFTQINHS